MEAKEHEVDAYFPAVQTANKSKDSAQGAMQPHVVSLQDEVMELQAMQCLGVGSIQVTHKAASANMNGALRGRGSRHLEVGSRYVGHPSEC